MNHRKQLTVFAILLVVYAMSAFITYAFFLDQMTASVGIPMPEMPVSHAVLGLANAGVILVVYGLLGLAGYWFAVRLRLPGIFSEDRTWQRWVLIPLLLGLASGVFVILLDSVFAPING